MHKYFPDTSRTIIQLLLIAIVSIFALFKWQSNVGLNLSDEGFLWYGAQRVQMGEVPIRDFMAYDIGRYYWSAAFMSIWGSKGIVALRFGIAVFQVISMGICLIMLGRLFSRQKIFFWILIFTTLLIWMYPQYRVFDISLPIILVSTLAFLIERPTYSRYFLTGLIVGLAAVFGRNHGIYAAIGSLSCIALLTTGGGGLSLLRASAIWLMGIIVGYLPVIVFLVVVPGFAQAFLDSILLLFENKATNITLPVPWPWLVAFERGTIVEGLRGVIPGTFLILIIIFGMFGIVWAVQKKLRNQPLPPVLIAAIFMTLPYAHYAYSRADVEHLAAGIPPFLIGVFALLETQHAKIKWIFSTFLCGASLLLMLPTYSGWVCYISQQCVESNIAGDEIEINLNVAQNLSVFKQLDSRFSPKDQSFIAAPFWPSAYAVLERKSPMWEIYALFPRSDAFQLTEVARIRIANPKFVVIDDSSVDGREETRFSNTHPILDRYIRSNFEPIYDYSNPIIRTYKNKQAKE